jgi:hypothetical protein
MFINVLLDLKAKHVEELGWFSAIKVSLLAVIPFTQKIGRKRDCFSVPIAHSATSDINIALLTSNRSKKNASSAATAHSIHAPDLPKIRSFSFK